MWSLQAQSTRLIAFRNKNPSKLFVTAVFDLLYALPEVVGGNVAEYPARQAFLVLAARKRCAAAKGVPGGLRAQFQFGAMSAPRLR